MIDIEFATEPAMAPVTDRSRELVVRSLLDDRGDVLVAVEDSGVGIDPEKAKKIFNAFFTTKPSGMGWACRYAALSSRITAESCGPHPTLDRARLFSSLYSRLKSSARRFGYAVRKLVVANSAGLSSSRMTPYSARHLAPSMD